MKKGWEVKKLGEVCNVIGGGTPSKAIDDYFKGDIPWATVRDMRSDIITKTEFSITKEAVKKSSTNIIPKGNVIIATRVGLGKVCFNENDTAINQDLRGIIPINNAIPVQYLFWWLKSISQKIIDEGTGATVQGVKLPFIKSLQIPFPKDKTEQQRIISILDETFASIELAKANVEKNLQNAKELFQSELNSIFSQKGEGWKKKKLGTISFVKSGGTPSRSKKEYWEGDIPWYSSGELNNMFTEKSNRTINNLAIDNSNAKIFPKGSLLIGMYDTAALKMSILDRDAAFNQAIAGVIPNEKIDLIFILHAINSNKPELLNQRRGVRQKNLSLEKIKDINIYFPKIEVQQQIVQRLEKLSIETNKLENKYQAKMDSLEELKKSVLAKAFRGEL